MSPDRPNSLQASSLVRLVSSVAAVSLVAAAGVVVIESQSQTRPLFQIPAAALTLGAGALAIYAGSLAVSGRRTAAQLWWVVCIVALVLLPTLQVLPMVYDTIALLDPQGAGASAVALCRVHSPAAFPHPRDLNPQPEQ